MSEQKGPMKATELLAELRNKLSPIKNSIEMQRLLINIKVQPSSFTKGFEMSRLEQLIEDDRPKVEQCMAKVDLLLDLLEEYYTNQNS